jgi:hypothetical protein
MKVLFTAVLLILLSGCAGGDCKNKDNPRVDEQTVTGESVDDNTNTMNQQGNGAHHRHQTGSGDTTDRSSGGVGNVNAETGVNPNEASNGTQNQQTTKTPGKPGTTGTRNTQAAGTGTSSGRSVN